MGYGMNKFNLEKALAGEKVVTDYGAEVTCLTLMVLSPCNQLVGVSKGIIHTWNTDGSHVLRNKEFLDLKMAPVMGSGFLYVYVDGMSVVYKEKKDWFDTPIMIFDLSEYLVGFGL